MRWGYKTIAILIALSALPVHAVRTNGVDPEEKYIELGQEERFAAVGSVTHGIKMGTGTLIASDMVLTSGHLFNDILQDTEWKEDQPLEPITLSVRNSYVNFHGEYNPLGDYRAGYEIESVTFNPYYVANVKLGFPDRFCFDYAFVKLKEEVSAITPMSLFDIGIGSPTSGILVGFGGGDDHTDPRFVKRGALNSIHYHRESGLFSSLYFTPLAEEERMHGLTPTIRNTNEGNRVWHKSKQPYGLAQAGDSGGPLIIKCQNRDTIIGVVVGGGKSPDRREDEIPEISEIDQDPFDPVKYYGKYCTSFAPIAYYSPAGGGFVRSSMINKMQKAAAAH